MLTYIKPFKSIPPPPESGSGFIQTSYTSTSSMFNALRFLTETAVPISVYYTTSTAKKWRQAVCSSTSSGYFISGLTSTGTYSGGVNAIRFFNETGVTLTSVATALSYTAGSQSNVNGYTFGGRNSTSSVSNTDRLVFSTETVAKSAVGVGYNGRGQVTMQDSTTAFAAGGGVVGQSVKIDYMRGLVFSTETTLLVSAVLSTGRSDAAGVSSDVNGYVIGGSGVGSTVGTTDRFAMTTLTSTQIADFVRAVTLTSTATARYTGFVAGGDDNTASRATISGIKFNTEISTSIAAVLSTAWNAGNIGGAQYV